MRSVLAIDGGGIRGLIPAVVLADLEERAGAPVAELFDLVAGTSTGGILALGLSVGAGAPRWSAADLVGLYEEHGDEIFHRSPWRTVTSVGGLIEERYPAGPLEDVLQRYLGEAPVSQALTEVLLTAYDIERRQPYFFKRHKARGERGRDAPMWLAARATAAAPTYFEPARVPAPGLPEPERVLIDGGVYANNPAMCAWVEANKLFDPAGDIVVVSLGTGELTRPITYGEAADWGLAQWAVPLLGTVLDGVSDTVDHQLDRTLNDGDTRYWRLQTELTTGSDDLDDASATNLRALRRRAEDLVAAHDDTLTHLARLLAGRGTG